MRSTARWTCPSFARATSALGSCRPSSVLALSAGGQKRMVASSPRGGGGVPPPVRRFLIMGSLVVAAGVANAWYRSRDKVDPTAAAGLPTSQTSAATGTAQSDVAEPHRGKPFTSADVWSLPENKDELKLELYQYSYQPSSAQVRSYLDFHRFNYKVIEVNPINRDPLPYPPDQRKTKQIPLLFVNGREISVAVHTILFLERYLNRNNLIQQSPEDSARVADVMHHIDQNLIQLVQADRCATLRSTSRIMRPLRRADTLSTLELVYVPPLTTLSLWWNWKHSRRLLRRVYGDDLRVALVRQLDAYCDLLGDRQFFGGEDPGLVDIYLHGVLHCVEDEETGRYAFTHAQPRLSAWYQRMQGRFVASQDDTRRAEQQAPAKS